MYKVVAVVEPGYSDDGVFSRAGAGCESERIEVEEANQNTAAVVARIKAFQEAGWTASLFGAARVTLHVPGQDDQVSIVQVSVLR